MKKVIAASICSALVFISPAFGGSTTNYGGIKIGTCKEKTFQMETVGIDEFELVGFNSILVSVSGNDITVALCATEKGKFSNDLLLKNGGNVISSIHLEGVGVKNG